MFVEIEECVKCGDVTGRYFCDVCGIEIESYNAWEIWVPFGNSSECCSLKCLKQKTRQITLENLKKEEKENLDEEALKLVEKDIEIEDYTE